MIPYKRLLSKHLLTLKKKNIFTNELKKNGKKDLWNLFYQCHLCAI